jgi:hypothetical protein
MQTSVHTTSGAAAGASGLAPDRTAVATPARDDLHNVLVNRISWGAVFAGVVLMLAMHVVLNMIGAGIGAATIDPRSGDNPSASAFTIGAAVWWTLSGIVATFVGAMVAGRLSGSPRSSTGALHGVTAWALTLLVLIYLVSSAASTVAGGALGALSNVAGGLGRTAATTVAAAAPEAVRTGADPFAGIEQSIRGGGNDPAAMRDNAVSAVRALLTGDPAQAAQARDRAAEALARAQGIPIEEARARIGQYEQQYRQAADQAKAAATTAADATARAVSQGMLLASLGLLFGVIAAWFGGRFGAARQDRDGDDRVAHLTTTRG